MQRHRDSLRWPQTKVYKQEGIREKVVIQKWWGEGLWSHNCILILVFPSPQARHQSCQSFVMYFKFHKSMFNLYFMKQFIFLYCSDSNRLGEICSISHQDNRKLYLGFQSSQLNMWLFISFCLLSASPPHLDSYSPALSSRYW